MTEQFWKENQSLTAISLVGGTELQDWGVGTAFLEHILFLLLYIFLITYTHYFFKNYH